MNEASDAKGAKPKRGYSAEYATCLYCKDQISRNVYTSAEKVSKGPWFHTVFGLAYCLYSVATPSGKSHAKGES